MTVDLTATWSGPFEFSADYDNAHWYNMAVRGDYYVTTDKPKEDGSLAPVLANAIGLVEDAYQWAFVGNPWNVHLLNKAKGAEKAYAWVSNDNASVPTFVDVATANAWTIKRSTSSVTGAFMLTTDIGHQVNQFGGATGSLKIWDSTGTGDAGSAFTVFDVPTNFAEFVASEISPYFDTTAKYFVLTDAAKEEVNYNPDYKTECSYEAYKSMKEKMTDTFLADLSNYVLPETGYYILKNKNYGTYMGISPNDAELWGNYEAVNAAKHIVKLTKNDDNTYTIGLMGKFAPATVAQSTQVIASADAANYTVVIPAIGYAAFQADPSNNMSALHRAGGGNIVGWEAPSAASQWEVIDAAGTEINITVTDAGYATAYLPFPATTSGVNVFIGEYAGEDGHKFLNLIELDGIIPALTPVILKGDPATYKFAVVGEPDADGMKVYNSEVDGDKALVKGWADPSDNVLKGTLEPIDAVGKYVLAKPDGLEVAFYLADSGKIAAGLAYLEYDASAGIKAFYFDSNATGIKDLKELKDSNDVIFNVAGQRMSKMQKGINIVNGKKILF